MGTPRGFQESKPGTQRRFAAEPGPPVEPSTTQKQGSSSDVRESKLTEFASVLGEFANDAAQRTGVSASSLFLAGLSFTGAFIGRTVHARWGDGSHHPLLCVGMVATSATAGQDLICHSIGRLFGRVAGFLPTGHTPVLAYERLSPRLLSTAEASRALLVIEGFGDTSWSRRSAGVHGHACAAWDGSGRYFPGRNAPPALALVSFVHQRDLFDLDSSAHEFAGRCLWCIMSGHQVQHDRPQPLSDERLDRFARPLAEVIERSKAVGEMQFDRDVRWDRHCDTLKHNNDFVGSFMHHGPEQMVRLAILFAMLDKSEEIKSQHVEAALSVWLQSRASVERVFGVGATDPGPQKLLALLRVPHSRKELHALYSNHKRADRLTAELESLEQSGLVVREIIPTAGRPREQWRSKDIAAKEGNVPS